MALNNEYKALRFTFKDKVKKYGLPFLVASWKTLESLDKLVRLGSSLSVFLPIKEVQRIKERENQSLILSPFPLKLLFIEEFNGATVLFYSPLYSLSGLKLTTTNYPGLLSVMAAANNCLNIRITI